MKELSPEKISIGSKVGAACVCSMCRKDGTTDQFTTLQDDKGEDTFLCEDCKGKVNTAFAEETENPDLLYAVLLGTVGAAIGGMIWFLVAIGTGREIGYVSLGLGYLVGYGVYYGAGQKRGYQLQMISALLAIIAIVVTEKFIFDYFLNDYVRKNPSEFPDHPVGKWASVSFFEPVFWKSFMSPIGLLIYAFGIYLAFNFCKPRKL